MNSSNCSDVIPIRQYRRSATSKPTHLQLDSAQLARLSDSGSPDLAADRAMEARSAEALKLAHQGYWPDFTVGYSYEKTGPGFRDYYMLTLGAKIPLYFWRKQTPAIEQAALEAESAREQTQATQLEVSSVRKAAWSRCAPLNESCRFIETA